MDTLDEYGLPLWPAAERNKQVILEQLVTFLPTGASSLLEISAATGQHAVHFARALPELQIQTTDYDPEHLSTLRERVARVGLENLLEPLHLDVTEDDWDLPAPANAPSCIYNANMMHIAPIEAAQGLFRGAGRLLNPGARLITYGPYLIDGKPTSESNAAFDQSLRGRDSRWGIRDMATLDQFAAAAGLQRQHTVPMPANNFLLVWDKQGSIAGIQK